MANIDVPRILQIMVKNNAADVFLYTGAKISMKTPKGFAQLGEPLGDGDAERAVREILSDEKLKQFEENGEVDFSLSYNGIGRFRGNAFRQRGEASLVLRHINTEVPTVDSLGVPQVLKDMVMERNGLILVVGATGSGKSTTLAAMIDHRNDQFRWTYPHPGRSDRVRAQPQKVDRGATRGLEPTQSRSAPA